MRTRDNKQTSPPADSVVLSLTHVDSLITGTESYLKTPRFQLPVGHISEECSPEGLRFALGFLVPDSSH
jgi:hypothetical protein